MCNVVVCTGINTARDIQFDITDIMQIIQIIKLLVNLLRDGSVCALASEQKSKPGQTIISVRVPILGRGQILIPQRLP